MAADIAQAHTSEDDDEEELVSTGRMCMHCMDDIVLEEDTVIFEFVEPYEPKEGTTGYLLLQHDTGEPKLSPTIFCFYCYENLQEIVEEQVEDLPPMEDPLSKLACDFCKSGIRIGEACVTIDIGEIVFSPRKPFVAAEGLQGPATKFEGAEGDVWVACLSCTGRFLEASGNFDGYTSILTQNGECFQCTSVKCWRTGRCMCRCHHTSTSRKE